VIARVEPDLADGECVTCPEPGGGFDVGRHDVCLRRQRFAVNLGKWIDKLRAS
jgi:hypothetical protein